jgi:hypothetical protein
LCDTIQRVRVLTILARFGTEQYPHAEQEIDDIFQRRMPGIDRTVIVVDNALPRGFEERHPQRVLIGGDNSAREFSAFDCAIDSIGSDIWSYDLVHFATSAFNTLYVSYLQLFDMALLRAMTRRPVGLGHIDCYNDAVEILGIRTQHWIRTCFFFLPPTEVKVLGSFVTIRDGSRFFSANPDVPFRSDAPLTGTYREYITNWLTGGDIGQGVQWHSRLMLTRETLPAFENKALSIMNEHLLAVRLRAMSCRLIDVTWLAARLARDKAASVQWNTNWREQVSNRDRGTVVLSAAAGAVPEGSRKSYGP